MAEKSIKPVDIQRLPVDKIKPGKWNVRTIDREKGIPELAESILKYGLLQPIVVFQAGDEVDLIIGQRRLRAFKELKKSGYSQFKEIPAIILSKKPDEESSKILSLSENIHRVELNRADVVEVISYFYNKYKSAKKVKEILGKSISYVYEHLKIQYAPVEVRQMLSKGDLKKEDVKRLMEIAPGDKARMIELAKEMRELTPHERKRLAEVAKTKPDMKVRKLIPEARKPHIEEKIIVPLTPALRMALDRAVRAIGLSQEEVAKKALQEWLSNKGYYKE